MTGDHGIALGLHMLPIWAKHGAKLRIDRLDDATHLILEEMPRPSLQLVVGGELQP